MGVYAVLEVRGRVVSVTDPSGGTCNAAGDFDRLLPVTDAALPVLSRVDPHGERRIPHADLAAVTIGPGYCWGAPSMTVSAAACSGCVHSPALARPTQGPGCGSSGTSARTPQSEIHRDCLHCGRVMGGYPLIALIRMPPRPLAHGRTIPQAPTPGPALAGWVTSRRTAEHPVHARADSRGVAVAQWAPD
jgi:hypothetical protein